MGRAEWAILCVQCARIEDMPEDELAGLPGATGDHVVLADCARCGPISVDGGGNCMTHEKHD